MRVALPLLFALAAALPAAPAPAKPDPSEAELQKIIEKFAEKESEFLAARESVLPWIKQYSPMEHVTNDDPPVYLFYSAPPALGEIQKDPTHTANYGVKLQEKCKSLGLECELVYPGAPGVKHPQMHDFLIAKLKAPAVPSK